MPAGFSARCRVCTSPHRAKIEEWLAQGLSPRAVAAKLAAELGERIGHVSIWNHQREHWNIGQETARRYAEMTAESQQRLEAEASRRVDEIRALDEQIEAANRLRPLYEDWLREAAEKRKRPPMAVVQAYTALANEVRQAAKVKAELLGDDPESRKADAALTWLDLVRKALAGGGGDGRSGHAGSGGNGAGKGAE